MAFLLLKSMIRDTVRLQVDLRSSMGTMDIGEVAERSGVPASTLRYYEEIGLIRSVGRHGLRRQFDPDALRHVAECPAPSHLECPTFRKLLKTATRRRVSRPAASTIRRGRRRLGE